MKTKIPKFTDSYRFARPYRHAKDTDVGATFADEFKRLASVLKVARPFQPKVVFCDLAEVFKDVRRVG